MSLEERHRIAPSIVRRRLRISSSIVEALLRRLLSRLDCGHVVIDTPDGARLTFSGAGPGPEARLTVHTWRCLRRLAFGWDIGFAEAYAAGEVSTPDMAAVLRFACHNEDAAGRLQQLCLPPYWGKLRHALNRNTRSGSRRNIRAHYDLGNDFYRHWLDAGMTYSSGLFASPDQSLESAQHAKLARVAELLELSGGERVLEIGCGWGSMAETLLRQGAGAVTGLTLSAEQFTFCQERLAGDIASGTCELRLQDYRETNGSFDRIVSIEMLEAVGEAYWPVYFAKLRSSLREGGIAVLQVITIDEARFDNYRRRPDFIQKHIFPGGMLPTPSIVVEQAARAGLRTVSCEFFGDSYRRTLNVWQQRFQRSWPRLKQLGFDERFRRTWEYYFQYCQAGFDLKAIDVGLYKFVVDAQTRLPSAQK
jgi:cyclopropane-fatty-acyl-phospholipid synthase